MRFSRYVVVTAKCGAIIADNHRHNKKKAPCHDDSEAFLLDARDLSAAG
jgi:hypothetical protein